MEKKYHKWKGEKEAIDLKNEVAILPFFSHYLGHPVYLNSPLYMDDPEELLP